MKSERNEAKNEEQWDKLLHIHTTGRDDSKADQFRYPYEPTPYSVLQRLANEGLIRKGDTLIDYGCGKGRVDFFLSYQTKCHTIGVEYDERLYEKAMENRAGAVSAGRVNFELVDAVQFPVPEQVDCAYFFNPFSLEILQKVIARLLESYYACPRKIRLFFYYPSDEYISYLMSVDELMFVDEIPCMDLFEEQSAEYKESVLPKEVRKRVAVEALSDFGWGKYVGLDGACVTMTGFGASGPAAQLFEHFGFTAEHVADVARSL